MGLWSQFYDLLEDVDSCGIKPSSLWGRSIKINTVSMMQTLWHCDHHSPDSPSRTASSKQPLYTVKVALDLQAFRLASYNGIEKRDFQPILTLTILTSPQPRDRISGVGQPAWIYSGCSMLGTCERHWELPSQFPTSMVNGGRWIHLTTAHELQWFAYQPWQKRSYNWAWFT